MDAGNNITITKRSASSRNIQTSGITGEVIQLQQQNNHMAAFTSLNELYHLPLSGTAIGTHQPATGSLSTPVLVAQVF